MTDHAKRNERLTDALSARIEEYDNAVRHLRDLATPESGEEPEEMGQLIELLREAVEMARVARRMLRHSDIGQVHAAFGAPGDFGYGTPIGAALARLYRGE